MPYGNLGTPNSTCMGKFGNSELKRKKTSFTVDKFWKSETLSLKVTTALSSSVYQATKASITL